MEKVIIYSQSEVTQSQQLEQERIQILAQVGALMMDLETARKSLDNINERRNTFMRQMMLNNGITQFESARPTREGMVVTVPDEKIRPNGAGDVVSLEN